MSGGHDLDLLTPMREYNTENQTTKGLNKLRDEVIQQQKQGIATGSDKKVNSNLHVLISGCEAIVA